MATQLDTTKGLQIWLPLTKDLHNQGLAQVSITNNGATYSSTGGKLGGCYYNTTTNKSVVISGLTGLTSASTIDITMWLCCTTKARGSVFSMSGTGTNDRFILGYQQGSYEFGIGYGESPWPTTGRDVLSTNVWHFIRVLQQNKQLSLYIDGELVSSKTTSSTYNLGNLILFPIQSDATGVFKINDFRLYSYALSPQEIKELARGKVGHWLGNDPWVEGTTNVFPYYNFKNIQWVKSGTTSIDADGMVTLTGRGGTTQNYYHHPSYLVTIKPNTTYTLSVTAKLGEGSRFAIYFYQKDSSGATVTTKTKVYTPTDGMYHTYSITITTTSNIAKMYAELNNHSGAEGSTIIMANNSLQLEEKDHPTLFTTSSRQAFLSDTSGMGRHGQVTGGVTLDTSTPRYDKSLKIGTKPSYITINCPFLPDQFTFNWWGKYVEPPNGTNPNNDQWWFNWSGGSFNSNGICIYDTTIKLHYGTTSGNTSRTGNLLLSFSGTTDTSWKMYTLTFNGKDLVLYKNGAEVRRTSTSSTVYPTQWSGNQHTNIGCSCAEQHRSVVGSNISDFRLYATALEVDAVKELYSLGR